MPPLVVLTHCSVVLDAIERGLSIAITLARPCKDLRGFPVDCEHHGDLPRALIVGFAGASALSANAEWVVRAGCGSCMSMHDATDATVD